MVERQEVEALLAASERDYIGPHPDNETLAALCRAWLAVDGGIVAIGSLDARSDESTTIIFRLANGARAKPLRGQLVRIVPV